MAIDKYSARDQVITQITFTKTVQQFFSRLFETRILITFYL